MHYLLPVLFPTCLIVFFYGYTLDYIHFHKIVTYDLKDYCVDTGVSVIILLTLLSEIKKSKEKKDI